MEKIKKVSMKRSKDELGKEGGMMIPKRALLQSP